MVIMYKVDRLSDKKKETYFVGFDKVSLFEVNPLNICESGIVLKQFSLRTRRGNMEQVFAEINSWNVGLCGSLKKKC